MMLLMSSCLSATATKRLAGSTTSETSPRLLTINQRPISKKSLNYKNFKIELNNKKRIYLRGGCNFRNRSLPRLRSRSLSLINIHVPNKRYLADPVALRTKLCSKSSRYHSKVFSRRMIKYRLKSINARSLLKLHVKMGNCSLRLTS